MQNLVCAVAAGFVKELLVQRFDCGCFVTLAKCCFLVRIVNRFCTQCTYIRIIRNRRGLNRLSASVYATAGTGHNLYKLIVALACFDILQYLLRIGKTRRKSVV